MVDRTGEPLDSLAEFDDEVARRQRHGAQFRSVDLGVAVQAAEVGVEKAAVVERRQAPCLVVGERAGLPVDVVQVVLETHLGSSHRPGKVGRRRESTDLFLCREAAQEDVVAVREEELLGALTLDVLRLVPFQGPGDLHRAHVVHPEERNVRLGYLTLPIDEALRAEGDHRSRGDGEAQTGQRVRP